MSRGIYYLLSVAVSIIVIIFLARFFGVTWADVHHFIKYGIGGALGIIKELRNSIMTMRNPL